MSRNQEPDSRLPPETEPVSKSERKRQATRLQDLGRELTRLKAADLQELDLPERLANAIADYQRFPSHEARRRQLQFIGRLMRDIDVEPIVTALDALRGTSAQALHELHQLERWRERLIDEAEALTEFIAEHPTVDRQQLRTLLQRVQRSRNDEERRIAGRALFRYLRDATQAV